MTCRGGGVFGNRPLRAGERTGNSVQRFSANCGDRGEPAAASRQPPAPGRRVPGEEPWNTPRFDGIGGGLPHRPVGIHPPAAALHIGAEPAVIVQVGPAAAPVFGAGSTVLIPGGTGFVAALCIPGAVVLAWKHQVRSFQCKEGRAGFRRPPEGTISRCFGTAPVYRAEIAPIQPRCELQVKPKTFLSPVACRQWVC